MVDTSQRFVWAEGRSGSELQEGVAIFFVAHGCGWAVAGNDLRLFGENEQATVDGVDDLAGVTAGQVGASDAAGEERVAGDEQLHGREVEANAALGVAGRVQDCGRVAVEADAHAVGEAGVRWRGLGSGGTEPGGLLFHHGEQRQVIFIEQDGRAGEALETQRSADVVNVGVRDEDLGQLEAELGEAAMDAADLFSGIDDDGFVGCRVAQDGAVALQRTDREGFEDGFFAQTVTGHEEIVGLALETTEADPKACLCGLRNRE